MSEDELNEELKRLGFHIGRFTTSYERSWYEDSWSETIADWRKLAELIEAVREDERNGSNKETKGNS